MRYKGIVRGGVVVFEGEQRPPDGSTVEVELAPPASGRADAPEQTLAELLMEFSGILDGLPPDLAENHDHYLHGLPKRAQQ